MSDVKKPGATKKSTDVKKKNVSNNKPKANDKVNNKPKDNNKTNIKEKHTEPEVVRVKEIKVTETNDYETNDEDDKKLVVIIAIAILIIMATIIGLLVGCEKKEKNLPAEPDKDNTIVPVDKVIDEGEQEEQKPVVKKTTVKKETVTNYNISYYYRTNLDNNYDLYKVSIPVGNKIPKFVPEGYENCKYYTDKNLNKEFDFSVVPTSNKKIYMVCSVINNTVTYKDSNEDVLAEDIVTGKENNSYVILSGEDACKQQVRENNPREVIDNVKFLGWSNTNNNEIAYHEGDKIKLENDLELTPVCGVTTVKYTNKIVDENEKMDKEVIETVVGVDENQNNTPENNSTENELNQTNNENPKKDEIIDSSELPTEEVEKEDSVEVGYTQDEVDEYDINNLKPNDVGLETPVYYVPVKEESDNDANQTVTEETPDENKIFTVVDDSIEEINIENEIRLKDVMNHVPKWYTPQVNDKVIEKPYDFVGWTKPVDKDENNQAPDPEPVNPDDETEEVEEVEKVPDDWKPSVDKENDIYANWELNEEDAVDPNTDVVSEM